MSFNRGREFRCFECSGKGHLRPQCPNLTLYTTSDEKSQFPHYGKICTSCDGRGHLASDRVSM